MDLPTPRRTARLVLLVSAMLVTAMLTLPSATAAPASGGVRGTASAGHTTSASRSLASVASARKKHPRAMTLRRCNRFKAKKHRRACRRHVLAVRRHQAAVKRAKAKQAAIKAAQAQAAGTVPVKGGTTPTVPSGNTSEFSFVGEEGFAGSTIDRSRWWVYDGKPGCCPDTVWSPQRVRVANGALELWNQKDAAGTWLSGGVGAAWPTATRTYGKFETRLKFSKGAGSTCAALLWPVSGWPPEVDFYEIGADWGDRAKMMMTTHWGSPAASAHRLSQQFLNGDFSAWHTVTVEWTPTRLDYYLDGRLMKSERDQSVIPHQAMRPGYQVHIERTSDGRLPSSYAANPTLSVDYVKVWKYNG